MSDKVIWKYKFDSTDDLGYASYIRVDMPKGAKIINLSYDDTIATAVRIYLHAIVNPEHKEKARWFAVFAEKMPMEDYEKKTFEYIGMAKGGAFNYHIFEVHD